MRCLPELTIYGENSYDYFGRSLASGDVDGDGYADVIVGADGGDPGETVSNAGEVYVFFGSNAITYTICSVENPPIAQNQIVKELAYLTTTADITITGVAPGNGSGYDVSVGDLNHDGYDDVIIGAPYVNGNRGRVYVIYGGPRPSLSPTISLAQADLTVSIATTNTWLGSSVFAGDINHDGTDDLLMGAIGIDPDDADYLGTPTSTQKGTAFALFGHPTLSGTLDLSTGNPANFTILGASPGDWLGRGLAVGDLNGDSFNELLVGAAGLNRSAAFTDSGAAYIFNFIYPQHVTVTGNLTQVVAGNPAIFTATATSWLDTRDVTTQTTFALPPAASGSWNRNVYTSSRAGTWPVSGTFDGLVVGTTSLTVLPGPFATITISPTTAFALPDTVVELQATGLDLYGNSIAGLTFAWSIVNGGAQIVASGPTTLAVRTVVTDATYPNTVLATTGGKSSTASIVVLNAPPQANFTCGSCTSPEGSSLSFNASTSSDPNRDPLSYAWSFGDGRTASGKTTSHTFSDNGSYTVTLTVSDDKGLTGTYQCTVTITNVPPTPTISAPTSTLNDKPVTFTANPNDPGADTFEYRWYWGDGTDVVITTTPTVRHTFTSAGVFTVTLHATDDDGGTGATNHTIHVLQGHYIYLPMTVRSS